jgi:photosystem II stability/assembly factor-like uncharacterized protein
MNIHGRARRACIALFLALTLFVPALPALAQVNPELYSALNWRLIGPFRGGRIGAVVGIPSQPNVFYMSADNGGVWKTTDAGATWVASFTGDENNSIGSIAIAPSDPNVIYAGSGEATQRPDLSTGDGLYRSGDAGKTWQHLGLRDGQQIPAIAVDPHDANRLFVAVLGHPYGPNAERGIFRSTDGGKTFQKVLYKGPDVGAAQVVLDPADPDMVYAVLWASRVSPWRWQIHQGVDGSGVFKSTDGGATWKQIGKGLPTVAQGLGRIWLGIAPSAPSRVYASVGASSAQRGLYLSDDAGLSFRPVNHDPRNAGGWITVAPNNPDEIYVSSTAWYHSTDAGKSYTTLRGAPGGNDYHHTWINPDHPEIMAIGVDQGATITVNGGKTWSTWYNQPLAQSYHVATDNQFPYRVYSSQQDTGSLAITSRSNDGQITFRDWHPVGGEEYAYIAPDPLDPNITYSSRVVRYDWRTGESQQVGPQVALFTGKYRFNRTAPLLFSPADPHVLYLGSNVLFKTTDGGHSWQTISPDLSRPNPGIPANLKPFAAHENPLDHRGVIYSIGPSFKDANTIWAGTDDGLIWLTRDGGKHWQDVTPKGMTAWSKVTQLVASHYDEQTAYASVSRFRLDDLKPYIYRTHDGGKTWQLIVNGLPDNASANVVREDPVQKGLLFAGTERAVWFSADDGAHWQSLQQNLPQTSMRDLVIHDNDIVLGTHGRALWILDDISPLRQLAAAKAASTAYLYQPAAAYQLPRNAYSDTQLEPEFPAGQNPPSGAIIDYLLKPGITGPVTLDILDASGKLVRHFSSTDQPPTVDPNEINFPTYWLRAPQGLSAQSGMHRFVWNLLYPSPPTLEPHAPMGVIYGETPMGLTGVPALPGQYTVKLTAGGQTLTRSLTVRADPRVDKPMAGLEQQFQLGMQLSADITRTYTALRQAKGKENPELRKLNGELIAQYNSLYGGAYGGDGDNASTMATPTTQQVAAVAELRQRVDAMLGQ